MEINYHQIAIQAVGFLTGLVAPGAKDWTNKKVKDLLDLITRKFHGRKDREEAVKQFETNPSEAQKRGLINTLEKAMQEDPVFAANMLEHVKNLVNNEETVNQSITIQGSNSGNISQVANIERR